MHKEEHCTAKCKGCANCQERKTQKTVNISDVFLSKAIYTKKPTYYTNMQMDHSGAFDTRQAPPSSFSEPHLPQSPSAMDSSWAREKSSASEFTLGNSSFQNSSTSPKQMDMSRNPLGFADSSFRAQEISQNPGNSVGGGFPLGQKGMSLSSNTSFSFFNGNSLVGEPWNWPKRGGSSYINMQTDGAHASPVNTFETAGKLSKSSVDFVSGGHRERIQTGPDTGGEQSVSSQGYYLPPFINEISSPDGRLEGAESMLNRAHAQKSLYRGDGMGDSLARSHSHGFTAIDELGYLSTSSNNGGCAKERIEGAVARESGCFGNEYGGKALEVYNPIQNPTYDVAQLSQLRCTYMSSSVLMLLINMQEDPAMQHSRLNELLGLPKIQPQHAALTKSMLKIIISYGGLQVVDEKNLWGMVTNNLGQKADDIPRLRMYYIVICYPYEQICLLQSQGEETGRMIAIVYVEPKKADIMPEIINLLGKRKKIKQNAHISEKAVETSGILECLVTLNGMYANGVQNGQELIDVLKRLKGLTCQSEEIKTVFSCQEMALVEKQIRVILVEWIAKSVEETTLKEIEEEKAIIETYEEFLEHMLAQVNRRERKRVEDEQEEKKKSSAFMCMDRLAYSHQEKEERARLGDAKGLRMDKRKERSRGKVEENTAELQKKKGLLSEAESALLYSSLYLRPVQKTVRICARRYIDLNSIYVYPSIELKERKEILTSTCTLHRECRMYQDRICGCGDTVIKFDTAAELYYSTLQFLAKSTALHVSARSVSFLTSILEILPEEALSFRHRYIYKGLISLWNILKKEEMHNMLFLGRKTIENACFLKIAREVRKLLNSMILIKQEVVSVISNGQLEIIFKIANVPGGEIIMAYTPLKRLLEVWHFLFFLVCDDYLQGALNAFQETILIAIDELSVYLHKNITTNRVSGEVVLSALKIEDGDWLTKAFSLDIFAESVYSFCNFIYTVQNSSVA